MVQRDRRSGLQYLVVPSSFWLHSRQERPPLPRPLAAFLGNGDDQQSATAVVHKAPARLISRHTASQTTVNRQARIRRDIHIQARRPDDHLHILALGTRRYSNLASHRVAVLAPRVVGSRRRAQYTVACRPAAGLEGLHQVSCPWMLVILVLVLVIHSPVNAVIAVIVRVAMMPVPMPVAVMPVIVGRVRAWRTIMAVPVRSSSRGMAVPVVVRRVSTCRTIMTMPVCRRRCCLGSAVAVAVVMSAWHAVVAMAVVLTRGHRSAVVDLHNFPLSNRSAEPHMHRIRLQLSAASSNSCVQ